MATAQYDYLLGIGLNPEDLKRLEADLILLAKKATVAGSRAAGAASGGAQERAARTTQAKADEDAVARRRRLNREYQNSVLLGKAEKDEARLLKEELNAGGKSLTNYGYTQRQVGKQSKDLVRQLGDQRRQIMNKGNVGFFAIQYLDKIASRVKG